MYLNIIHFFNQKYFRKLFSNLIYLPQQNPQRSFIDNPHKPFKMSHVSGLFNTHTNLYLQSNFLIVRKYIFRTHRDNNKKRPEYA